MVVCAFREVAAWVIQTLLNYSYTHINPHGNHEIIWNNQIPVKKNIQVIPSFFQVFWVSPTFTILLVASSVEAPRSNHRRLSDISPNLYVNTTRNVWAKLREDYNIWCGCNYYTLFHDISPGFRWTSWNQKTMVAHVHVIFLKFQSQKTQ